MLLMRLYKVCEFILKQWKTTTTATYSSCPTQMTCDYVSDPVDLCTYYMYQSVTGNSPSNITKSILYIFTKRYSPVETLCLVIYLFVILFALVYLLLFFTY